MVRSAAQEFWCHHNSFMSNLFSLFFTYPQKRAGALASH